MPYANSLLRVESRLLDLDRRLELRGARLFLLKRGVETKRFVAEREITRYWSVEFSAWRSQMTVSVGALDEAFPDDIVKCSFVGYGLGRGDDNSVFDVFQLNPENKEVIPPTPKNPFWRAFCLVTTQRYIHPVEVP